MSWRPILLQMGVICVEHIQILVSFLNKSFRNFVCSTLKFNTQRSLGSAEFLTENLRQCRHKVIPLATTFGITRLKDNDLRYLLVRVLYGLVDRRTFNLVLT